MIKPALASGQWVIGDRHDLSSQAYQGGGRQLGELLTPIKEAVLGDFKPDLTIYLDIDPALGLSRARARGELDRIEQNELAFFERARAVYLEHANNDSTIVTVDASQSLEQVQQDIKTIVSDFIKRHSPERGGNSPERGGNSLERGE